MALSIFAPREGSLPCIFAGRVGSCSPAICSCVFFLPLPSSGSFWSLAAARRLAMLRSSSACGASLVSLTRTHPVQTDLFYCLWCGVRMGLLTGVVVLVGVLLALLVRDGLILLLLLVVS